jgi:hypothetical protein
MKRMIPKIATAGPGEFVRAARLLGVSDARRSAAPPRLYTEQSGYDRTKALLRDKFTEDELAVLVTEGHHWSHDRALDEAATMRLS